MYSSIFSQHITFEAKSSFEFSAVSNIDNNDITGMLSRLFVVPAHVLFT